ISFSPGATLRIVSPDSVTIFSTGAVAGCVPPPATGLVVGASCAHRAVPIRATSASAVAAAALVWRKREFMARSSSLARIDRPRHVQQLRADDNAAARAWVVPFPTRARGHASHTRLPGLPDENLHARPLLTLRGCQLRADMYNERSLEVPGVEDPTRLAGRGRTALQRGHAGIPVDRSTARRIRSKARGQEERAESDRAGDWQAHRRRQPPADRAAR